jgi:hypothetical protein
VRRSFCKSHFLLNLPNLVQLYPALMDPAAMGPTDLPALLRGAMLATESGESTLTVPAL